MRLGAISFEGVEDLTRQSFKDECDVNNIVKTYSETGMINHIPRGNPQYGEAPESDFFTAAVITAEIASKTEEGLDLEPTPEPTDEGKKAQDEPENAQDEQKSTPDEGVDKQSIPL